jgi:hypothetical protein
MTKPIPLQAARASLQVVQPFIPPVTGLGGSTAPVANSFDGSGNFRPRDRVWSASKRARTELEAAFDLSQQFPPLEPPEHQSLDLSSIKSLLVAATALSSDVIPLCDGDDTLDSVRAVGQLCIALLRVVEGMVEKGLVPLSSCPPQPTAGRGYAATARQQLNAAPPLSPRPLAPGREELQEALEKADKESVVFGVNLGELPLANRSSLNTNFSVELLRKAEEKVEGRPSADLNESTRLIDDALACADKIEFLGARSQKFVNKKNLQDPANGSYLTMPVRLIFNDKDSRINFERTMRECCGICVVQSLPEKLRKEMMSFKEALQARYPGRIVSVRPDSASASFIAFQKKDGDAGGWSPCWEKHVILNGILLPGYNNQPVVLPPVRDNGNPVFGSSFDSTQSTGGASNASLSDNAASNDDRS